MKNCLLLRVLALVISAGAALSAAPHLRVDLPQSLREDRPIWIPVGQNGPGDVRFELRNDGDGVLNPSFDSGPDTWLVATAQGAQACTQRPGQTCIGVVLAFNTAALPAGEYNPILTISDPAAVDAPQRVQLTVYIGSGVPERVDLWVRPAAGSTDSMDFQTPQTQQIPASTLSVNPAGSYLSVSSSGNGSFQFVYEHQLRGTWQAGLAGDVNGSMTVANSSFAPDNRQVPVTLHVTDAPIASVQTNRLVFFGAPGAPVSEQFLVLANRGTTAATVGAVNVATADGAAWLTAEDAGNGLFRVSADAAALAAGSFTGTVSIETDAANSPHVAEVVFHVRPDAGPLVSFRGIVNGASFDATRGVSPGSIVSLFGSQNATAVSAAGTIPLPTALTGTSVTVNGIAAPLFFTSEGQINFQLPNGTPLGLNAGTVVVTRDGAASNPVSVDVAAATPGIFRLGIGNYGAIINASQGGIFVMPADLAASVGIAGGPARPGDVLTIFCNGLGATTPPVADGVAAPSAEPLARVNTIPMVAFQTNPLVPVRQTVLFAGLSPGFVGLYQVNVAVPMRIPTNDDLSISVESGSEVSNLVSIAVTQ